MKALLPGTRYRIFLNKQQRNWEIVLKFQIKQFI